MHKQVIQTTQQVFQNITKNISGCIFTNNFKKSSLRYLYRFFVVYFTQMLKKNNLLEVLYKSLTLQQIELVAIHIDDNDLDCRELFSRIHSKIDEILSLVFKDFGTVIALVQMLANITFGRFNFDFL